MKAASSAPRPALILDACERQALVSVRSLGRAGVPVHAAERAGRVPAFSSRWCRSANVLPDPAEDPSAFIEQLLAICRGLGNPVVIPCHDGTIEVLRAHRAELERVASLALAPEPVLAVAIDKERTLTAARQVGIAVPEGITVAKSAEVPAAVSAIAMPAVVKPAISWMNTGDFGWRSGPMLAATREATAKRVEELLAGGTSALVQSCVPGAREAVSTVFADGEFLAVFAQRADRMTPVIGGSSVVRESIPLPPDIAEQACALVRKIGLEGYAEVEFRRDAAGRPLLMEINPRLSASVEVAVRAGVDFPLVLYRWAASAPAQPRRDYRAGIRMRWLRGDIEWLLEAARDPAQPDSPGRAAAVRTFLAEFGRRPSYDYWDFEDPRPALVVTGQVTLNLLRRILRRVRSRLSRVT